MAGHPGQDGLGELLEAVPVQDQQSGLEVVLNSVEFSLRPSMARQKLKS